ncbi:MAG: hypothetical protein OEU46_00730 [Alphaproteobacteria bacterium]|nr:hypothetical protein [Alphaproteobacteria bacterium]
MWNLFGQRRAMEKEVFETLRPGDLYGETHGSGRQPEELLRYIFLANATGLTFFLIMISGLVREAQAFAEFVSSVWLLGMSTAIAIGAWILFRLSRARERVALGRSQGGGADGESVEQPSDAVMQIMRRAAVMKLLAFRVMIVSGIALCVGVYLGLKGLFLL